MALVGSHITLKTKGWKEEELAKRLAFIVAGQQRKPLVRPDGTPVVDKDGKLEWFGYEPYKKENGSWQLDMNNNWFFFVHDGIPTIHTRYWNTEELIALDIVFNTLIP